MHFKLKKTISQWEEKYAELLAQVKDTITDRNSAETKCEHYMKLLEKRDAEYVKPAKDFKAAKEDLSVVKQACEAELVKAGSEQSRLTAELKNVAIEKEEIEIKYISRISELEEIARQAQSDVIAGVVKMLEMAEENNKLKQEVVEYKTTAEKYQLEVKEKQKDMKYWEQLEKRVLKFKKNLI